MIIPCRHGHDVGRSHRHVRLAVAVVAPRNNRHCAQGGSTTGSGSHSITYDDLIHPGILSLEVRQRQSRSSASRHIRPVLEPLVAEWFGSPCQHAYAHVLPQSCTPRLGLAGDHWRGGDNGDTRHLTGYAAEAIGDNHAVATRIGCL